MRARLVVVMLLCWLVSLISNAKAETISKTPFRPRPVLLGERIYWSGVHEPAEVDNRLGRAAISALFRQNTAIEMTLYSPYDVLLK
jgi:hypothetical protein